MSHSTSRASRDIEHNLGTRRPKGIALVRVFSPWTFVALLLLSSGGLLLQTPLAWGSDFAGYFTLVPIYIYVAALSCGILLARIKAKTSLRPINTPSIPDMRWAKILFAVSTAFFVVKFVNIRDIPLFGDPMSRYNLTIGGYADYISRLVIPLGFFFFYQFLQTGKKSYLLAPLIAMALPSLLMQRQDVVILLIGCLIIWGTNKRVSLPLLILSLLAVVVIAYVVVGIGSIARYSAESISSTIPSEELAFWVIHAEFTVPHTLGAYATANTEGLLYGRYTFGQFFALAGSDDLIGAELINMLFVGASTAQSISAPYSFILDFGIGGMVILGVLTGFILGVSYNTMLRYPGSILAVSSYPLLLLNAYWSIRSGSFVLGVSVILALVVFLCSTQGGTPIVRLLRNLSRPALIAVILLGAVTMAIKFQ